MIRDMFDIVCIALFFTAVWVWADFSTSIIVW